MKINVLFLLFIFSLASANEENYDTTKIVAGSTLLAASQVATVAETVANGPGPLRVDAYVVSDTVLSDQIKAMDGVIASLEENNRPKALIDEAVATRNNLISQADDEGLVRRVTLALDDTFEEKITLLDQKSKYLLSVHPRGTKPDILKNNISVFRSISQRFAAKPRLNLRILSVGGFAAGAVTLFSAMTPLTEHTNPSNLSYEDVPTNRAEK